MKMAVIAIVLVLIVNAASTVGLGQDEYSPKMWYLDNATIRIQGGVAGLDSTNVMIRDVGGTQYTIPITRLSDPNQLYLKALREVRRAARIVRESPFPSKAKEIQRLRERLLLPGIGGITEPMVDEIVGATLPGSPLLHTLGGRGSAFENPSHGSGASPLALLQHSANLRWVVINGVEYKIRSVECLSDIPGIYNVMVEDLNGSVLAIPDDLDRIDLLPRFWSTPVYRSSAARKASPAHRRGPVSAQLPGAVSLVSHAIKSEGQETPRIVWTFESTTKAYQELARCDSVFRQSRLDEYPVAYQYHCNEGDRLFFAGRFFEASIEYAQALELHAKVGVPDRSLDVYLRIAFSLLCLRDDILAISASISRDMDSERRAQLVAAMNYLDCAIALANVDPAKQAFAFECRARIGSVLSACQQQHFDSLQGHARAIQDAVRCGPKEYLQHFNAGGLEVITSRVSVWHSKGDLLGYIEDRAIQDRTYRATFVLESGALAFEMSQYQRSYDLLTDAVKLAYFQLSPQLQPEKDLALPAQDIRSQILSRLAVIDSDDVRAVTVGHAHAVEAGKKIVDEDYLSGRTAAPDAVQKHLLRDRLVEELARAWDGDRITRSHRLLIGALKANRPDVVSKKRIVEAIEKASFVAGKGSPIQSPCFALRAAIMCEIASLQSSADQAFDAYRLAMSLALAIESPAQVETAKLQAANIPPDIVNALVESRRIPMRSDAFSESELAELTAKFGRDGQFVDASVFVRVVGSAGMRSWANRKKLRADALNANRQAWRVDPVNSTFMEDVTVFHAGDFELRLSGVQGNLTSLTESQSLISEAKIDEGRAKHILGYLADSAEETRAASAQRAAEFENAWRALAAERLEWLKARSLTKKAFAHYWVRKNELATAAKFATEAEIAEDAADGT